MKLGPSIGLDTQTLILPSLPSSNVMQLSLQQLDICQLGATTDLFAVAQGSPESQASNPNSNGIFTSNMVADGGIIKYTWSGARDSTWTAISNLTEPRGLALNAASTMLYSAHNGGVSVFSVTAGGATHTHTYDTSSLGLAKPNGLCLDATERYLYVTDPGWQLFPWQANGLNGLSRIDLQCHTITQIFSNRSGQTPNGCAVMNGIVYMANQKDGVTSYDPSTGAISDTLSWYDLLSDHPLCTW